MLSSLYLLEWEPFIVMPMLGIWPADLFNEVGCFPLRSNSSLTIYSQAHNKLLEGACTTRRSFFLVVPLYRPRAGSEKWTLWHRKETAVEKGWSGRMHHWSHIIGYPSLFVWNFRYFGNSGTSAGKQRFQNDWCYPYQMLNRYNASFAQDLNHWNASRCQSGKSDSVHLKHPSIMQPAILIRWTKDSSKLHLLAWSHKQNANQLKRW